MEFTEENMKFEKLSPKQADYVYGKLKLLEELAADIEIKRESYTRLLLVNDRNDDTEFEDSVLTHEKRLSPVEETTEPNRFTVVEQPEEVLVL